MWEYHRLGLLYSPSVRVVRDADYYPLSACVSPLVAPHAETFAVLSCAAIRAPAIRGEEYYANPDDRDVTRGKMHMICQAAVRHDVGLPEQKGILITGLWGCGAFCNPIREVCRLWVEVASAYPLEVAFSCYPPSLPHVREFRRLMTYYIEKEAARRG